MKGEIFYPLTPEITNKLRKAKLTAAEWRIWSYLIELDPWGDRYIDIETLDVMSQCDCSKATFYRAIAKFQKLGLFDFQDKGFSYKNETGASRLRKSYRKNETEFSKMRQPSQKCETSLKNETEFSEMRQLSQKCENQSLEPLPEEDSGSPQTIQTYSDFIQTLSESERENFLNFVREQIKNLPKPVNDLEAWLANQNQAGMNRWEVYYNNFLANQPQLKSGLSVSPKSNPSKIQELAAQCRQKHTEELEEQRIAALRAQQPKTSETQSSSFPTVSDSVQEKLAELLDSKKKSPFEKPNESEDIKQWRIEIELQEQRRIDALLKKIKGGSQP